jgi:hypothetical protein
MLGHTHYVEVTRMRKQTQRIRFSLTLALGLSLVAPSLSAEMYSWHTEDGGMAYTDDRDQIPARYADQAKRVRTGSLEQYERFTASDDAAQETYATRLGQRLAHLRAMNAAAPRVHPGAPSAAPSPGRTISIATGNARVPEIQVPVSESSGPIIVEPVNAKQAGDFRTRRVTVIRQGGKTVAVVKGSPVHHNPSTDIYDEEDLEKGNF